MKQTLDVHMYMQSTVRDFLWGQGLCGRNGIGCNPPSSHSAAGTWDHFGQGIPFTCNTAGIWQDQPLWYVGCFFLQNKAKNSYIILQFNLKIKMLDEVLGLSLGWRCSYEAPACLVLFWWMIRDEPVSTRVGGFAIHEGWPILQIDNLSYRILMDKLPSQKQHAHVEMYTYTHYKSNKMLGPLSIIFTLRYSSKSLAKGGEPPSGHHGGTFQ